MITLHLRICLIPTLLRSAFPLVPKNAKICLICRRQIYKQKSNLFQTDAKEAKIVCDDEYHKAGVAVLQQIKKKFSESTNKQERIQLLTLAPEFWSHKNLMREFNCSEREAREAKDLVANNGIFSIPAKKRGKLLPADTVNTVKSFYERDDVSRIMPGLKDYLSIKQSNAKENIFKKDYCLVI